MNLKRIGWQPFFEQHFYVFDQKGYSPARIAKEHKGMYAVYSSWGKLTASLSGRFRYQISNRNGFPAIGDWVAVSPMPMEKKAIIHAVLPRKSRFCRKPPVSGGRKQVNIDGHSVIGGGLTEEQILAANIDIMFFMLSLDGNFNLRRIERYIIVGRESGASIVIILNKSDVCPYPDKFLEQAKTVAGDIPVHAVSALDLTNLNSLHPYFKPGHTIAISGSSGVGKSTLINAFLGKNTLNTGAVREYDGKGRHTTTWREMVLMDEGTILIDTPGMRELQIWVDEETISETFGDVENLIGQCRFSDCSHNTEPGCAVREAIEKGKLDIKRWHNYQAMKFEARYLGIRKKEKEKLVASRKKRGEPYKRCKDNFRYHT
ncbi:ribosome small subunit-dependent GTPase A [bacterium]|nr:ribosome small subunit-dependent GTPase A [candidate division CSSED10-310 bacterium]